MNRLELGKEIYKASHLSGEFILSSGQTSTEFFDITKAIALPSILIGVTYVMSSLTPLSTQVFAAVERGGIPLAKAISLRTGEPMVIVKKTKKKDGTRKIDEAAIVEGKSVCIVEDVITTGRQVIKSAEALRRVGANPGFVMCVLERTGDGRKRLEDAGIELRSAFTQEELEDLNKHFR